MAGSLAKKYFLGQGVQRVGCAQSVAEALRHPFDLEDDFVKAMAGATGGRAPLGYCGAVYAALRIAEEKVPGKKEEIENYFKNTGGGLTCRDIRAHRKLSCVDCVQRAADMLSPATDKK